MASASLTPYDDSSSQVTFNLVSQSATGATYKVASRDLATPFMVEITRKLTAPSASSNDHIVVRVARVERNADTGKLATLQCLVDVSIPKDTSILDSTAQLELLGVVGSLLNDSTAMEATTVARTAIIEGRDL